MKFAKRLASFFGLSLPPSVNAFNGAAISMRWRALKGIPQKDPGKLCIPSTRPECSSGVFVIFKMAAATMHVSLDYCELFAHV